VIDLETLRRLAMAIAIGLLNVIERSWQLRTEAPAGWRCSHY